MLSLQLIALAIVVTNVSSFGVAKASRFLKNSALNANIMDTAEAAGNFKDFISFAKATGIDKLLTGSDKYTVFAPTDEAFSKVPISVMESLASNPESLLEIIKFHVHPGIMNPTRTGRTLDTLMMGLDKFPKQLTVKVTNWECESFIFAGQEKPAKVTTMGIKCDNGLIHELNEVLLPYEGDVAPTVTFIGKGGISIEKTLQLSYYGTEKGKGRDAEGIKVAENYGPISVGETWKKAGNWDNALGYFDEVVEFYADKGGGGTLTGETKNEKAEK